MANAYIGMALNNCELFDGTKCNFKMYGELQPSYFRNSMTKIIKENMIDRFIILLDTFMLHGNDGWFLNIDTSPAKTFFWFPTDGGGGLPVGCANILKKIDMPIAMSEFGQKQAKDYHNIDTGFIPHGVDLSIFYKKPEEERNRFRVKYGLIDKFVIGVVARNQPRKQLDKTLKTMKLVSAIVPNAILFMHIDADDPAQSLWKIRSLISKFGLENRVIFSGMESHKGFANKDMGEIYNVMDCFFLSTSGEGFGIPIIEAMACEVPIIATNYTTTPELVINNKAGYGVNLAGVNELDLFGIHSKEYDDKAMNGTITGSWEVERGICDVNDAAKKIVYLYDHPERKKEMGLNGRKAVIEKYDFELVGKAWNRLMEEK